MIFPDSALIRLSVFFVCLLALTVTSVLVLQKLRIRYPFEALLGVVVLNAAQVVLVIEILSLFRFIHPVPAALVHLGAAVFWGAFAARRGQTFVALLSRRLVRAVRSCWNVLDARLIVLGVGVLLAGIIQLLLALALPPDSHDSMTYHLARVGYYLQQGSLEVFPTANVRQTAFPANSEILMLWQVLWLGTDRATALIQWCAGGALLIAVYVLARSLYFSRNRSLFASLVVLTFPEILLQSSSTQNDLLVASFMVASLAFLARSAVHPRQFRSYAFLAAVSIGLALGTKSTVLMLMPGFVVFSITLFGPPFGRVSLMRLVQAWGASVVAFLLLGSYIYLQNTFVFGSPAGPASMQRLVMLEEANLSTAWANSGRLWLQLVGPSGWVPPAARGWLRDWYESGCSWFLDTFSVPSHVPEGDYPGVVWGVFPAFSVHEDFCWFGPLFGVLGLPLLLAVIMWLGPYDLRRRALAFTSLFYFVSVAVLLRWQPWHGRILVPAVAVTAPLLGICFHGGASLLARLWTWTMLGLSFVSLYTCSIHNDSKPLLRLGELLPADRLTRIAPAGSRVEIVGRLLDQLELEGRKIGLVSHNEDEREYVFFGRRFERRIIPIRVESGVKASLLTQLDGILLLGEEQRYFLTGEQDANTKSWVGQANLAPLLARIRASDEWMSVFDVDGVGHLFLRAGLPFDGSVLGGVPEVITFDDSPWYEDKWVSDPFRIRVKVDSAQPAVKIRGEFPANAGSRFLTIRVQEWPQLRRIVNVRPGPFEQLFSLEPLPSRFEKQYVSLLFSVGFSFNPRNLGISPDSRNLSWRLCEIQLTGRKAPQELSEGRVNAQVEGPQRLAERNLRKDFVLEGQWWSDMWVGERFRLKVRFDPARPLLELRGEFPVLPRPPPTLKLIHEKRVVLSHTSERGKPFLLRLDLRSLLGTARVPYAVLEFQVDDTFNPEETGDSKDRRELGWRLHGLSLSSMS